VPDRDRVPSPTEGHTWSPPPEGSATSTSAVETWLELAPENVRLVSSLVVWAPGTVFTGASFTAVRWMVTVSVADLAPPVPVLPWSLVSRVKVSSPLWSAAGLYTTPFRAAFTADWVPVKVMVASLVPSPAVTLSPVVPDRDRVP